MATVICQWAHCTGYEVRIETGGRQIDLWFASEPTEQQLAERIDEYERRLTNEIAAEQVNENEEILI
jgi:hypothetical protein